MKQTDTPFFSGWWSFDLGKYRPCSGTYCYYDYASIPPLAMTQFHGTFDWLQADSTTDAPTSPIETDDLAKLQQSATDLNLTLPAAFIHFMKNTLWQDSIPSCTACYFELSEIIPNPLQEKHYFIPFLIDQQSVLIWYLYLNTSGDFCVVVSPLVLMEMEAEEITPEKIKQNTFYCGETFESFIYRFWMENTIWFALHDEEKLTSAQKPI